MKRIYKFRAWHKENKRMYILGWNQLPNAEVFVTIADLFKYGEDAILMQFTGLSDKNGVEIYEGDICTFTNPYNKQEYKRIVRYCPLLACFGLYIDMETVYDYESDWLKIINIEVIGNIYENPELL